MRRPIALYAFALLVRLGLIAAFPHPAYVDSYYYVNVAQALQAGHGLNIDFIWAFVDVGGRLPANPHLPIPSNAHWMPLASLVQVPFLALFGSASWAPQVPFALFGALAAPLTWAIAREAGASRSVQLGAGLLGAVPAGATIFMSQPDNFGLYEVLGAAALWLTARGLRGDSRGFALAGLLVGFATLARNDGVLIGLVVALAFFWDRWRAWRSGGGRRPAIPFWSAVACAALFAVVMVPWYARELAVFGSISPSSSSGRILFIRDFAEMNSITTPTTLAYFLGQGIGPLVTSRVLGLVAAAANFAVIICSLVLAPFLVVGAWRRRRSGDFGPFLVYFAVLFAFSALVSAVHVPYGTFLHSAVALAPHTYVLALEGVVAAVGWVARRRRSWHEEQAVPVFLWGTVGLTMLTAAAFTVSVVNGWTVERNYQLAVAAKLDRLGVPASDRLMTIDAGGYRYTTGHGGVVTVNDPLPTIEQVAKAYDIRWLVLERGHIVPPLVPVLGGQVHQSWIGPPVLTIPSSVAAGTYPELALYPVCVAPGDARCAASTAAGATP